MPCYDPRNNPTTWSLERYNEFYAKGEYGEISKPLTDANEPRYSYDTNWGSPELTKAVACELARRLKEGEDLAKAPGWVLGWIENHKREDEKRKAKEEKRSRAFPQRQIPVHILAGVGGPMHKLYCDDTMFAQARRLFLMHVGDIAGVRWQLERGHPVFQDFMETALTFYRRTTGQELPIDRNNIRGVHAMAYPSDPSPMVPNDRYTFTFHHLDRKEKTFTLSFEDSHSITNADKLTWMVESGWYQAIAVKA